MLVQNELEFNLFLAKFKYIGCKLDISVLWNNGWKFDEVTSHIKCIFEFRDAEKYYGWNCCIECGHKDCLMAQSIWPENEFNIELETNLKEGWGVRKWLSKEGVVQSLNGYTKDDQ